MARPLSPKQELFVKEYLVDLNATQAAIRAGYKDSSFGRQLLTKTHVSAAIQAAKGDRAERLGIKADDVLSGIVRCTSKAENEKDYRTALKGFELQGKHLGLFVERKEFSGPEGTPIMIFLDGGDREPA